jgi:hypothetical protein
MFLDTGLLIKSGIDVYHVCDMRLVKLIRAYSIQLVQKPGELVLVTLFCPHFGVNYEKSLFETFPVNYDEDQYAEDHLVCFLFPSFRLTMGNHSVQ